MGTLHCTDIASYTGDSSVLRHRQLRQGLLDARISLATSATPRCSDIASYAGDSSVLRHRQLRRGLLGARILLATPGTPRCSDIASYAGDSLGGRIFICLIGVLSCGRTARNNTLREVLVFHQTLSTPKAGYRGRYPSGTPRRRTQKIHIFPKDPIMRTSYNTCKFIH